MKFDLFGTKAAKAVERLSNEVAQQQKEFEIKLSEERQLNEKAIKNTFFNSINNFNKQIFPTWQNQNEMDAYHTMDMVYAVVSKLATTAAMIPFYAYDKKADTDLPDSDKLVKFLETLDFEEKEKLYTYLWLSGEVFAYKNKLDFGVNAGLQKLTFLNPSCVTIILSESFPIEIVGYRYQDTKNGVMFDIQVEDMIFIKFFNPSNQITEEWRGLSPIKVLARTLTRLRAAEDATVAQLQNGGVPGIVYDKTPGLDPAVIGKRRDNFGNFINKSENKGAPYFSANDLGYIALGTPLTDMEVMALQGVDFDRICNAYGVSSTLFNNKSASTESNVENMIREMYTNTIIPNVHRIEAALNKNVVPDIQTKGVIRCDVSEIDVLKKDLAKLVTALNTAWWLKGNEKREAMEYDQDTAVPELDQYIIPSSMMLIEDLSLAVAPVDNTANDYNNAAPATGQQPAPAAKLLSIKTA